MKTILPQWNRTNLDNINENFKSIVNIPEQLEEQILSASLTSGKALSYFFEPDENHFNASGDFLFNRRIGEEGKLAVVTDYVTTNAIRVKANTSYQATGQYWSAQYSATGKFLKYAYVNYRDALVTEAQAAYIILSIPTASIERFMFAEGVDPITYTNDYKPYRATMNNVELSLEEQYTTNIFKNAWFEDDLSNWPVNAGSVTVSKSGDLNFLTMDSEVSSQVKQIIPLKANHKYFVSFEVSVTRYVKGLFGIQVNGTLESGGGYSIGKRAVTNGFEKVTGIFKALADSNTYTYVGSISSANGAGQIGKLNLYDLTAAFGEGNEPSLEQFESDALPINSKGMYISTVESFKLLNKKIQALSEGSGSILNPSDGECINAFVETMNRKCKQLGMEKTTFINPHGLSATNQLSTTHDILLLTRHAAGTDPLLKVWGAKTYQVHFRGSRERTVTINATVTNAVLESSYTILGGKSGTIGSTFNALTLLTDEKENIYVATVMKAGSTTDRYEDIKKLADVAKKKLDNPSYVPTEEFTSLSGSVGIIENNPLFWTNAPKESFYAFNENQQIGPASMTKVMTAIVMLEHIHDLAEVVTVKSSDITGGSGPVMYEGDKISYLDILYLLMLPSSNSGAAITARTVGKKIIQARGYI